MTMYAVVLRVTLGVTRPSYEVVELRDTSFVEAGPSTYSAGWTTGWEWPNHVWPSASCFATREAALAHASELQRAFDAFEARKRVGS